MYLEQMSPCSSVKVTPLARLTEECGEGALCGVKVAGVSRIEMSPQKEHIPWPCASPEYQGALRDCGTPIEVVFQTDIPKRFCSRLVQANRWPREIFPVALIRSVQ